LDVAALSETGRALRRKTHETIARADDDYGRRLQFNTVVAAVMELTNLIVKTKDTGAQRAAIAEAWRTVVLVLSPIVPHICHDLWLTLGGTEPVVGESWPELDEAALVRDTIELVVQVNGKVRSRLQLPADADEATVLAAAQADEKIKRFVGDKVLRKVIYVPTRLVNLVIG
jgi:leucyl-tRNA synthetase